MIAATRKLIASICYVINFEYKHRKWTISRKMKLRFVKSYKYVVGNLMTGQFLCPSSWNAMVKLLISNWNGRAKEELSYRRTLQSFTEGQGRTWADASGTNCKCPCLVVLILVLRGEPVSLHSLSPWFSAAAMEDTEWEEKYFIGRKGEKK